MLERLKLLRDEMKLSQQELADRLNVSRECYSLYETGRRHIPTEVLRKLSYLHKVSIDYLLEVTDERTTKLYLTPDENKFLDRYKQLDRRGKRVTMSVMLNEINELKHSKKTKDAPTAQTLDAETNPSEPPNTEA